MKFLYDAKKISIAVITVLNLITFTQSFQTKLTHAIAPTNDVAAAYTFLEVNHLVNRGYSLLADQSSLLERPASLLAKFDIFDYQLDMDKVLGQLQMPGDLIINVKEERNKGQKILKEYSPEEIVKAQDFAISGNYKLPNSNYLYQRSRSIRQLHHKKTVLYFNEKIDFTVSIDNKSDFPKLNQAFLSDALLVFNRAEVKNFENEEEYLREGFAFIYKYGTHYITKSKWGSRSTLLTEIKLEQSDLIPSSHTLKTDTNVKPGQIGLESDLDKEGSRFSDFDVTLELGSCQIDTTKNDFKECKKNISNFGLIGYEVDYLYNLFNPAAMTTTFTLPDKSTVSPDKIENIHKNLINLINAIEMALYVKNSVVSDVVVFNNISFEDIKNVGCAEKQKSKRFRDAKTSLYSEDYKVDKLNPIFKIGKTDAVVFYDLSLFKKRRFSTFACTYKRFNLEREDLLTPQLFNQEFINGIKISTSTTLEADNVKPEDCTNLWTGKNDNKNVNDNSSDKDFVVNYLCVSKTSNLFDSNLITDIKVKSFTDGKCDSFVYNERNYDCLCDKNLLEMVSKNTKGNSYICYSKKTNK